MKIGAVKEIKIGEERVALTPQGVRVLTGTGHQVLIQQGAGLASGFTDDVYVAAGAIMATTPDEVASTCDLLVKVKEPQPSEYNLLRPNLILFTFLGLAPLPKLTEVLLRSRTTSIAYENVELADGSHPLLTPMSQIAGRMAAEMASQYLRETGRGEGKLLGGIPEINPARCVVLGCGNVATYAISTLVALGGEVTVLGLRRNRLKRLSSHYQVELTTRIIDPESLAKELADADVLISGVLDPSGVTPKLVSRAMVRSMGEGSVIIDVSIDQGGVCETSHPTSHENPIYVEEGVTHCCIPNLPGAVPRSSTEALTAATFPYIDLLATEGQSVLLTNPALAKGVNTIDGHLVMESVAIAQGLRYSPLTQLLKS